MRCLLYILLITLLCETKDRTICQVLCGCLTSMIPNLNVSVYTVHLLLKYSLQFKSFNLLNVFAWVFLWRICKPLSNSLESLTGFGCALFVWCNYFVCVCLIWPTDRTMLSMSCKIVALMVSIWLLYQINEKGSTAQAPYVFNFCEEQERPVMKRIGLSYVLNHAIFFFCCVMLKSFRLIQMLTCNALKEKLEDKKLEENNNG